MYARHTRLTVITFGLALVAGKAPLLAGPLPADPNIVTGKLSNGVAWMYRQHDNPPGKMALMIHVDAGSLNETDAARHPGPLLREHRDGIRR